MSRTRKMLGWFAAVVTVSFCWPAGVSAQQLDEETRQRAREAWGSAVDDYDAGRYEEALTGFRQVYDLTHKPEALLNIAECYYFLMEPAQSMTYFQRARRALGDEIDATVRQNIEDKIAKLEDKVARLVIDVDQDGASVTVDGQDVGRSPILDPIYVLPGNVRVSATRAGRTVEERVMADRGREVQARLRFGSGGTEEPTPGTEEPTPGTEEPTPGTEEPTPGTEEPTPGTEEPTPGTEEPTPGTEEPTPPPPPPPPSGPGRLQVTANVEGARVLLDGDSAGEAPYDEEHAAGIYQVVVEADGYESWSGEITVRPEMATQVSVQLLAGEGEEIDPVILWSMVGVTGALAVGTITAGALIGYYDGVAQDELDGISALSDWYIDVGACNPRDPARSAACLDVEGAINRRVRDREDALESADSSTIATGVLAGLTVASAAATLVLYFLPTFETSDAEIGFSALPSPEGAGLSLWGRF